MNLLVSVESLRERLEFDNTPKTNSAIRSSLSSATKALETMIRTRFDAVTAQTDFFYPRYTQQRGPAFRPSRDAFEGTGWVGGVGSGGMYTLRLKYGFVTSITTLQWATSMTDLVAGNAQPIPTSLTGLAGEGYAQIDTEKGAVYIFDINLKQQLVQVVYNAGLTAVNGLYENVPDWLAEACMTLAIICLDEDYEDFRQQRGTDAAAILQRKDRLNLSLQQNIRYLANSEKPVIGLQ